jgi:hypothetical protein
MMKRALVYFFFHFYCFSFDDSADLSDRAGTMMRNQWKLSEESLATGQMLGQWTLLFHSNLTRNRIRVISHMHP